MNELSQHEHDILRFVERYGNKHGISPSIEDIRAGIGMKSKDHVHRDLSRLEKRKYLRIKRGKGRGIVLLRTCDGYPISTNGFAIPLWGIITAGGPIPSPDPNLPPLDWIEITRAMIPDPENAYALKVRGMSMIDALINDGDVVVLRKQETAQNGDLVAARLKKDPTNPETTLKRFFRHGDEILLMPENPEYKPIPVHANELEIQGKVIYVLRNTSRGSAKLRAS
ncbi:MAG: transcriptional repressor LexA [Chloroflexota bacterium]|nr:transcriptional repressor LexA [Chloroflexota bacterium]